MAFLSCCTNWESELVCLKNIISNRIAHMTMVALISLLIASFFLPMSVNADWFQVYTSDRAKTDSIQRVQVLKDWVKQRPFAWRILPLGDINDDNATEILVTTNLNNPFIDNPSFLYYGGKQVDTVFTPDQEFGNFLVRLGAIGDINEDGFSDILQYDIGPFRMDVYFGGPEFDDNADFTIPNHFSPVSHRVSDLDADGHIDLALSVSVNGGDVHIFRMDEQRDTVPEWVIADTVKDFGNNLAIMDINGDGHDDLFIACYQDRDTNLIKIYFGGPDFDTTADYVMRNTSPQFGKLMVPIGDFNADGWDDIFIAGGTEDPYGVFFGGPQFDDHVDVIVNESPAFNWTYVAPHSASSVGDFNSDGYSDFVMGYDNNFYYRFELYVFLGGPDVVAGVMHPDIYIEDRMIPGAQWGMGRTAVGIGDFTGDGIPDIATNCHESIAYGGYGSVYIFAGYDPTPTDVTYDYEPLLPDEIVLHQNYPNPFNPTTTIEFELPVGQHATVEVFNVLGQKVEILADRFFPAGLHKLTWDAIARNGKPIPSGVYLYRLKSESISETKKMVIVK